MIKAVIFDFNGTLLDDGWIHKQIWEEVYTELSGQKISEELKKTIYGNMNKQLIDNLAKVLKLTINDEDNEVISQNKERKYRNFILENHYFNLIAGATKLFDYLKKHHYPMIICTASIKENVDFFFKQYYLSKWFNLEETVYDNGTYQDKVLMYQDCAKKLNIELKDCLIFEDSIAGIKAAINAGAKQIVKVNTTKDDFKDPKIIQTINNFNEFNYHFLK